MIPAFNVHPSIATQHEDAIAHAMWKMEAHRKDKRRVHGSYGNVKNMGSSKKKYAWQQGEWDRRATLVRAFLKKHPGAHSTDIAKDIGIKAHTIGAWCDKFRNAPKDYGIRYIKSMSSKKYKYWRSEDMPKEGEQK